VTEKPGCVLDASALLAYVHGESGETEVRAALRNQAAISAVNWAEVLSKLVDASTKAGLDSETVVKRMTGQAIIGEAIVIWPFDERFAQDVARLRNQTRRIGFSLGDRACLALAMFLNVPVFTADRRWNEAGIPVTLRLIR
jgi:ribonuclease VapC